jgi:hypothetical protein
LYVFVKEVIVKKLLVLILTLVVVPTATAQIALRVCEADGVTPFDGRDIMVGSKLTLIVSSDTDDYWSGGLFIAGQDRALATLSARDSEPNIRDYTDSHYIEAGNMARVTEWKDSNIWGFDLYGSDIDLWGSDPNGSDLNALPGDWFIIDYEATGVGSPNLGFYDYSISWHEPDLLLTFHHDPTRDFNGDEIVDISDYATLASCWLYENCSDPNWCGGTDINRDSWVDIVDFALFEEYWLWGAPPGEEPNYPYEPADPNIIFSIVDANGLDEITINVNDSITLYVDMVTNGEDVHIFHVEADISDPDIGFIDNTEYDLGTARILAEPRNENFDYWGPGTYQQEGIELFCANIGPPISDGHMASFVYTCDGEGDVILNLIDWSSSSTVGLESIIIHQVDPNSQQMMSSGMSSAEASQFLGPIENSDVDELVKQLEQIWLDDEEVRETYSEDEWDEFVDSVRNEY